MKVNFMERKEIKILDKIKELRLKSEKTQVEFAKTYGIPERTIQDWELGRRIPPKYVVKLLEEAVDDDINGEKKDNINEPTMTITEMISRLNLSVAQFGKKYDIPCSTIYCWESGRKNAKNINYNCLKE